MEKFDQTVELSHINKSMLISTAAEPYGDEYVKIIKEKGLKVKLTGFVYYIPKNLDRSKIIDCVINNMRQIFCDDQFKLIYKTTSCVGYTSETKEKELDPANTSPSSFWKKMEDALQRPETSVLHSLRFKLKEDDAKIVFSQIFGKMDVDEEIERYRSFYDLGRTRERHA